MRLILSLLAVRQVRLAAFDMARYDLLRDDAELAFRSAEARVAKADVLARRAGSRSCRDDVSDSKSSAPARAFGCGSVLLPQMLPRGCSLDSLKLAKCLVRDPGLEPGRSLEHEILSLAWLPFHQSRAAGRSRGTGPGTQPDALGSRPGQRRPRARTGIGLSAGRGVMASRCQRTAGTAAALSAESLLTTPNTHAAAIVMASPPDW